MALQRMAQLVVAEPQGRRGRALVVAIAAQRILEQRALVSRDRSPKITRRINPGGRRSGLNKMKRRGFNLGADQSGLSSDARRRNARRPVRMKRVELNFG